MPPPAPGSPVRSTRCTSTPWWPAAVRARTPGGSAASSAATRTTPTPRTSGRPRPGPRSRTTALPAAANEAARILDSVQLATLPPQGTPSGPEYQQYWVQRVRPGLARLWPLPWPGRFDRAGWRTILVSWLLMLLLAALAVLIAILIFRNQPPQAPPPPTGGSGSPPPQSSSPQSGSPPPQSGSPQSGSPRRSRARRPPPAASRARARRRRPARSRAPARRRRRAPRPAAVSRPSRAPRQPPHRPHPARGSSGGRRSADGARRWSPPTWTAPSCPPTAR